MGRWRPEDQSDDRYETASDRGGDRSSKRQREGRNREGSRTARLKRAKAAHGSQGDSHSRRDRDRDSVEVIAEDADTKILRCRYSCEDPRTLREQTETRLVVLRRLENVEPCDFTDYTNCARVTASRKRNQDFMHKVVALVEEYAKPLMTKHTDQNDSLRTDSGWSRPYGNSGNDDHLVAVEIMILSDGRDLTVGQAMRKKDQFVDCKAAPYRNGLSYRRRRPHSHERLGVGIWAVGSGCNRDGKREIYHRSFHGYQREYYQRQASDNQA